MHAYCSYLLILDRTNWKTNILTSLLIPYIYFTLPSLLFSLLRSVCTLTISCHLFICFSFAHAANCLIIQWRGWEMDCSPYCCPAAFLPSTFSRYITTIHSCIQGIKLWLWFMVEICVSWFNLGIHCRGYWVTGYDDETPDWLELPGSLILLLVVAPSFFSSTVRNSIAGVLICLVIACYLLQEHIRASGGFRNAFTRAHGVSNTIGIILLFVFPVWAVIVDLL